MEFTVQWTCSFTGYVIQAFYLRGLRSIARPMLDCLAPSPHDHPLVSSPSPSYLPLALSIDPIPPRNLDIHSAKTLHPHDNDLPQDHHQRLSQRLSTDLLPESSLRGLSNLPTATACPSLPQAPPSARNAIGGSLLLSTPISNSGHTNDATMLLAHVFLITEVNLSRILGLQ